MYNLEVRQQALKAISNGEGFASASRAMGISRSTLRDWWRHPYSRNPRSLCPRCDASPSLPDPRDQYAYLLGLYLGDGCISRNRNKNVWAMRIMCADAYPGLLEECKDAIRAIRPENIVYTVQRVGCKEVGATSRHWPCLFPQMGPGRKHCRKIELEPWQRDIMSQYPGCFARGLFHSDGCRSTNRVRHQLASGERWYEYPRYMFTNQSQDILNLCGEALDLLGVSWRFARSNNISVARREAVARLDEFVGPKY
jgi:Helix-turn-helix domain